MKQKTFFMVFKGLSFSEKIKICYKIADTSFNTRKGFLQYTSLHGFFISNTFISNARLKLAKNQANAKQQPEGELLKSENYWHSSSTLSSNNNRTYSKK